MTPNDYQELSVELENMSALIQVTIDVRLWWLLSQDLRPSSKKSSHDISWYLHTIWAGQRVCTAQLGWGGGGNGPDWEIENRLNLYRYCFKSFFIGRHGTNRWILFKCHGRWLVAYGNMQFIVVLRLWHKQRWSATLTKNFIKLLLAVLKVDSHQKLFSLSCSPY